MTKSSKIILTLILILAFVLRVYNFKSFYVFAHDQDLASWIVKDIVINHHFRLIGQETSSQGVMIGALFYYLQIPFYLLGNMNPIFSVFLSVILGVFATYSIYYVFSQIASSKIGLIGSFIYAVSALIVFTDREVAPTMPVMLWSVWYLYSLFLIYKDSYLKGLILWAFLVGLVWHLNLALIIISPLVAVSYFFSKRKISLKPILIGVFVLMFTSSPFIFFELRHNFSQTKAIYLSLTSDKDLEVKVFNRFSKLDRVMQLVNRNSIGIFSKKDFVKPVFATVALILVFIYLVKYKKIDKFLTTIIVLWQGLYILFFTFNSLNPSEYYFNGMNVIWIFIASLGINELQKNKKLRIVFYFITILFFYSNVNYVIKYNTDKKGYVEKVNLVRHIKEDSIKNNYPCISISYITSPGYNLGYRYLFWLENMHVNKPISKSPVYTIVFPHSLVNKIDISFGSLGLIYPDYESYNKNDVDQSCRGDNANLTEPMFGYTQ